MDRTAVSGAPSEMVFATGTATNRTEKMRLLSTSNNTFACPGTMVITGDYGFAATNAADDGGDVEPLAGAGIRFVGNYSSSYSTTFAHIAGVKENTTEHQYGGLLTFHVREQANLGREVLRMEPTGRMKVLAGDVSKSAVLLRTTFNDITGHSSTGDQWFRCALLNSRTPYRVTVSTQGGNYGPGATTFTCLRSWDSTTFYVYDKKDTGSQYASQVRMQSDNGGGSFYLEIRANLSSTSQGFSLSVIPVGNNAGEMTTNLEYYGSDMTDLANTSSAQDI